MNEAVFLISYALLMFSMPVAVLIGWLAQGQNR
jgi:hypothetical protein